MPTVPPEAFSPLIGYWRQSVGSQRAYWSPTLVEVLGATPGEPLPTFNETAKRFEAQVEMRALLQKLVAGEPIGPIDMWMAHPRRGRRLIRISGGRENEDGAPAAFYGVAADITDLHQAAIQSAANEQLLETFIAHAPASLAMFDRDMRYLRVSPRWLTDYGLEGQELLGRNHYEVFPDLPDRWKEIHDRCLAGATEKCERDLYLHEDGTRQWLSWEIHPWFDEFGSIGGILMLTRDITALITSVETLERTEQRLQMALMAGDMIVWQRVQETGEMHVSGAFEKLMGRGPRSHLAIGDFLALLHPDDRERAMAEVMQAIAERRAMRAEVRVVPPAAAQFWARMDMEPIFDEDGIHRGSIGLMKDISQEREEKEELAAARAAAEAASQAKSDFLATMSHEIRTPLNGVLGVAQVLANTALDQRQSELVQLILSAGSALKTLVDDALDVERIESDALTMRNAAFDFAEVVKEASYLFAAAAAEKGLSFAVDLTRVTGVRLMGDSGRVRQVLSNLIGNALKFTVRGDIDIVADATLGEDGRAHFSVAVRDTGAGIELGSQAAIFERFRQAGTSDGGAGLGLTISRGLARAMDGDVRCESVPGRGSTFWFTGIAAIAPSAEDAATQIAAAAQAAKILVVEDHPANRKIVELMLEPFEIELTFAADGMAALEHFKRTAFDVVLMDIQMPRMDGIEAIRAFRNWEAMRGRARTPIICLTAQVSNEKVRAAHEAGADGHVSKPIVLKDLIEMIDRALSRARAA